MTENGVGLAGSGDAIGEDGAVESVQHRLHFCLDGDGEHLHVGAILLVDMPEGVVPHFLLRVFVLVVINGHAVALNPQQVPHVYVVVLRVVCIGLSRQLRPPLSPFLAGRLLVHPYFLHLLHHQGTDPHHHFKVAKHANEFIYTMDTEAGRMYEHVKDCMAKGDYRTMETILAGPLGNRIATMKDQALKTLLFHLDAVREQSLAYQMLELLLMKGANPREKDTMKQNVVYYIARDSRIAMLLKILEFDFNLNESDQFGQTPLFYSAKNNRTTEASELLIKYGCDVNHQDDNGQTCLYYAASVGNLQICRLLVDHGCNVSIQDNNKQKALHYAKKGGHNHVVSFFNSVKQISKRIKDDRRVQESSQPPSEQYKKKQKSAKSEYHLTYTNQNGIVHVLTLEELEAFKNASKEHSKLYEMICNPDQNDLTAPPAGNDRKFEKLALKILASVTRLENSCHFLEPVEWETLGMADYLTVVKYPMDFSTVRTKLLHNAYDNETEFQGDMNLVFDNCILYHGSVTGIGKISLQMKLEFNTMYAKEFLG